MNSDHPIAELLDVVRCIEQSGHTLPFDLLEELPPYSVLLSDLLEWAASPLGEEESYHEAFEDLLRSVLHDLRIDLRRGAAEAQEWLGTLHETLLKGLSSDDVLLGGSLLHAMTELDFLLSDALIEAANAWSQRYFGNMEAAEPIHMIGNRQLHHEAMMRDMLAEIEPETPGDLYQFLRPQLHYLPVDYLGPILDALLTSNMALLREAGLLCLLHARAAVRDCVLQALGNSAALEGLDARGRNRLVMLRNWLPAPQAKKLDPIIRQLAKRNLPPLREEAGNLKLWASAMDGSGASGLAAMESSDGRYRFSAAILKENTGIIDCVQTPWVRKTEAEASLKMFRQHLPALLPVSAEFLQLFIPHFLAANRDSGMMPEPLLLDWLEVLGDSLWQPNSLDAHEWLARHGDEIKSLDQHAAFQRLQRWFEREQERLHWFEQDDFIGECIEDNFARTPPSPGDLVGLLLAPYRTKWFERLVQLSIWAKSSNSNKKPRWQDFALLALALDAGAPINALPILPSVAFASIEDYLAREARLRAKEPFEGDPFDGDPFAEEIFEDDIFQQDLFDGPRLAVKSEGIGRNEPCPCGSGKKYKKCCMG